MGDSGADAAAEERRVGLPPDVLRHGHREGILLRAGSPRRRRPPQTWPARRRASGCTCGRPRRGATAVAAGVPPAARVAPRASWWLSIATVPAVSASDPAPPTADDVVEAASSSAASLMEAPRVRSCDIRVCHVRFSSVRWKNESRYGCTLQKGCTSERRAPSPRSTPSPRGGCPRAEGAQRGCPHAIPAHERLRGRTLRWTTRGRDR